MKKKLFNFFKSRTDQGRLLQIRSIVGYILDYVLNFPLWLKVTLFTPGAKPKTGETIGILSMYRPIFWHGNLFETHLNKNLEKKGFRPIHILCGGVLQICDVHTHKSDKSENPVICADCRLRNKLYYGRTKSETLHIERFIDTKALAVEFRNIDQLKNIDAALKYIYNGDPLGRWSHLSICRYWMRLTLNDQHLTTYKRFLKSAVMLYQAFTKMLQEHTFQNFLIFNGRYSTYRIPLEIIKRRKIKYSTYEMGEQEKFMFSSGNIAVMWDDVKIRFDHWLARQRLTNNSIEKDVHNYMKEREIKISSRYMDINDKAPLKCDIAVFTNLIWDSAAFERETVFSGQFDWISQIIQWAQKHSEFQLAIRIHPAETVDLYNKTEEKMSIFIKKRFPTLPKNTAVIEPDNALNSYQLVREAKVVTVYSSSIGLESALKGKTVLMAGWSHYAMDGIAIVPKDAMDYFQKLERALKDADGGPDMKKTLLYTYWYYKVYHRLNNTDLYRKPLVSWEDSRFFRVPNIENPSQSAEFLELTDEFIRGSNI